MVYRKPKWRNLWFESHIAFGVTLLALVAAAALLGFSAKTEACCKFWMKTIAYLVLVLGGLNLLCTTYYTVKYWGDGYFKTPYGHSCPMMNGKDGMKPMRSDGMMDDMMMKKLGQKDANYEDRFIDLMIPHHQAAIMMAKDAIEKSNKSEIKQLAQDIITAQKKEIVQMMDWRNQWHGH